MEIEDRSLYDPSGVQALTNKYDPNDISCILYDYDRNFIEFRSPP